MEMTPIIIFAQTQPASPAAPVPSAPVAPTTGQPVAPLTSAPQQPNPFMTFAPLILIFAIMYFIMIRPEQRRKKEHQKLLEAIKPGDKIVTSGGIHGTVVTVKDKYLIVKIAPSVEIKLQKGHVSLVVTKDDPEVAEKA